MFISKWLPLEDSTTDEYIEKCRKLGKMANTFEVELSRLISANMEPIEELSELCDSVEKMEKLFSGVGRDHCATVKTNFQCMYWRQRLNVARLSLAFLLTQAVSLLLASFLHSIDHLRHLPKLVTLCDVLFALDLFFEDNAVAVIRNTCPVFFMPMRKLSLTKLLQIVAQHRSEECAKELIAVLMYMAANPSHTNQPNEEEYFSSDNSSMDVYRELTGCLSPPVGPPRVGSVELEGRAHRLCSDTALLDSLLVSESYRLNTLFEVIARHIPRHLGPHGTKISKVTGEIKMSTRTKMKVVEYFQEVLWGQVGTHLEHILIWKGIGYHAETCSNYSNWLRHFLAEVKIPEAIRPALVNLKDGLCVHITSVTWDELFRKALVAAQHHHSRQIVRNIRNETRTGNLFCDIFEELVELSNSCEGSNWTVAALEELPLVEQIPILHRLDHSVHTTRLWAENRARKLANAWNMEQFFRVTQNDVTSCLKALSHRQFANQTDLLGPECSVHVLVCGNMRAKLVSEVNANIEKLQVVPKESIDILANVCRTFSLANLKIIFPEPSYWKQQYDEIPQFGSKYVEEYLEAVLRPVLESTNEVEVTIQQTVSCLVLDILCDAWLHHIYLHKIKFSEWGALQLLADFGAVPTWLMDRAQLTAGNKLLNTEALRRCEGVCRLLLSHPGHTIPTLDKTVRNYQGDASEGSPHRMPPEMYVPNQTQWLELRARTRADFTLCCATLFGSGLL